MTHSQEKFVARFGLAVVISAFFILAPVAVFHVWQRVEKVEVGAAEMGDDGELSLDRGKVTLSFDDGWVTQYTAALPILEEEKVKGTFYIISQETLGSAPDERVQNPSLKESSGGNARAWTPMAIGDNRPTFTYPVAGRTDDKAARVILNEYRSGEAFWSPAEATVMPNQRYVLSDWYQSTSDTEVNVRLTLRGGAYQFLGVTTLPTTGGAWKKYSTEIAIPHDATAVTLVHALRGNGSITVDDYSVMRVPVFMDPAQVLLMQQLGHEIGGHTQTHADLPTLPGERIIEEVHGSRTDLLKMGIKDMSTFAYPYGSFDDAAKKAVTTAGFKAARSVDRGFNTATTDPLALKIQQIDRKTTLADVQGWVQSAATDHSWLILMFHQIDDSPEATLGATPEFLREIIHAVESAEVDFITVEQGVSLLNR